jgi:hypothetical protein
VSILKRRNHSKVQRLGSPLSKAKELAIGKVLKEKEQRRRNLLENGEKAERKIEDSVSSQ